MLLKGKSLRTSALSMLTLIILLILFIVNSGTSSATDVFNAERGTNIEIASERNAFIGINYEQLYSIHKGDKINLLIQNNLPYTVNYTMYIQGDPISMVDPINFQLESDGNNKTVVIETKRDVKPGIYNIHGTLSALFEKGKSNINITFKIEIK